MESIYNRVKTATGWKFERVEEGQGKRTAHLKPPFYARPWKDTKLAGDSELIFVNHRIGLLQNLRQALLRFFEGSPKSQQLFFQRRQAWVLSPTTTNS
jgi:hypothetical protein